MHIVSLLWSSYQLKQKAFTFLSFYRQRVEVFRGGFSCEGVGLAADVNSTSHTFIFSSLILCSFLSSFLPLP